MTRSYQFVPILTMGMAAIALFAAPAFADHHGETADLSGKHVVFLVGENVHDMETLAPMAYLVNRGASITVVGVEPGVVDAYNSDITIRVEKSVDDVSVDDFDAMVIPGGQSPEFLRQHENVVQFAADFVNSGKVTAAICHGPQVLITAGVLEGRAATCFSAVQGELEEAGAHYQDVPVLRDGNIITSRIPDDIPVFCQTIEEAMVEQS